MFQGPFGDGICFQGGEWFPGGEYIQKLTVKNVSSRIRKLKYKLPDSPNFSMVFPEKIVLPPGMFVEIDVVFRPVHMQVHHILSKCFILFYFRNGSMYFTLPMFINVLF